MSSREPIFDDKGKEVIGVVGISVDITEKKKAAQALILAKEKAEVASQAKTEFLENMRHELKGNVVLPKISVVSVVNEPLAPAAAISSHGNHILIVEDNTIAANVAHSMLSKLGCQTDVASDGKTALEKIEKIIMILF